MKKFLLFILVIPSYVFSQQLERSILSTAGEVGRTDKMTLSWTLGELAVNKASSGNLIFTEGFQQGSKSSIVHSIDEKLIVWPNPSEDFVSVNWTISEGQNNLCLTDMNGKMMKLKQVSTMENQSSLDITDVRPGVYFLTLRDNSGRIVRSAKVCKIK
jgi:hypothetical protein